MRGGTAALWNDETMAAVFASRACEFIERATDRPFFLYYAFHQPHVPRIPGPRFRGSTPHGPRGDVIAEMDWCVGQVLDSLERSGIAENTIVIFSSDNGPVLDDGYHDRAEELVGEHHPAGPLRGGKYSMYDGGTRVPFILSWPETVRVGEQDAIVSHVDFYASFAALVDAPLEGPFHGAEADAAADSQTVAAPDSVDVLDALLGKSGDGRSELVVEGTQAKTVLRVDDWTYIPPNTGPAVSPTTHNELGNSLEPQLYNLAEDIGQIANRAESEPDRVASMAERLEAIRKSRATR